MHLSIKRVSLDTGTRGDIRKTLQQFYGSRSVLQGDMFFDKFVFQKEHSEIYVVHHSRRNVNDIMN